MQVFTQPLSLLSRVIELDIDIDPDTHLMDSEVFVDNPGGLDLFNPFTAVHTLHLSGEQPSFIVSSLRGLTGESVMEVLPALQNLYFDKYSKPGDEYVQQCIELFIAARQQSGHPITIHPCRV
jgi:hypothetical protein